MTWRPAPTSRRTSPRGGASSPCVTPSSPPCPGAAPSTWRASNVASLPRYRCAVLSALKHDYVARGVASHPRFELAVVADDPGVPAWAHERNQQLADAFRIPYVRDVQAALRDHDVQVAIV